MADMAESDQVDDSWDEITEVIGEEIIPAYN